MDKEPDVASISSLTSAARDRVASVERVDSTTANGDASGARPTGREHTDLNRVVKRPVPGNQCEPCAILSDDGRAFARFVKPAADRAIAAILLIVMAPVSLVVAGVVRLKLGRGVLYRQPRVGKDCRVFTMYKFRTLAPDRRLGRAPYCGLERRELHKSAADPRHTPFGRNLRKWSVDEIPQLWNVLVGNMSLVGPRPELLDVVERHDLWNHPRHLVKPGITGLWQISPDRGELLHRNLEYDVDYVSDIRFLRDLRILLQTPAAVLQRRGK